jgi:hypothetical protein
MDHTNKLVPIVRLFHIDGTPGNPAEVQGIPDETNRTYTYTFPLTDLQIAVFVKNWNTTLVRVTQRCVPTHGDCIETVPIKPQAEAKLPLQEMTNDHGNGFDVFNNKNENVLRLRFNPSLKMLLCKLRLGA